MTMENLMSNCEMKNGFKCERISFDLSSFTKIPPRTSTNNMMDLEQVIFEH